MESKNNADIYLREHGVWRPELEGLNPGHAVRILRTAGALELSVAGSEGQGAPLDRMLQNHQRSHRKMGRNDRLLLGTALYHLARNRQLLLEVGREFTPGCGDLLLLALVDALGPAGDLGGIRHLPDGVRPWRQQLGVLRRRREQLTAIIRGAKGATLAAADPEVLSALSTLFSVPSWWFPAGPWATVVECVRELIQLRRPQHLTLRIASHRNVSRAEVMGELEGQGIACSPTPRSPWGIVVQGRHNVLATPLYRSGTVEVQDEGSQLVAALVDPKPTETVLDLCAGGGGKALALATAMGDRGTVVAYDTNARKLEDVRRRARRAGLGNIRVVDAPKQVDALGPYDQVLADVPCTSTGTLRRNPDVAWRWNREELPKLCQVQAAILDRAAQLVRPGGYLIYATCSLLPIENGAQIESFLGRAAGFAPAPSGDRQGHECFADLRETVPGGYRLPADLDRYTGDGFFMARLQKVPL